MRLMSPPRIVTTEQLTEWMRLADEASPGPWNGDDVWASGYIHGANGDDVADGVPVRNIPFIVAAREAVPALVEEVVRLRAQLESAVAVVARSTAREAFELHEYDSEFGVLAGARSARRGDRS
jgi:hypothetical protein